MQGSMPGGLSGQGPRRADAQRFRGSGIPLSAPLCLTNITWVGGSMPFTSSSLTPAPSLAQAVLSDISLKALLLLHPQTPADAAGEVPAPPTLSAELLAQGEVILPTINWLLLEENEYHLILIFLIILLVQQSQHKIGFNLWEKK